jgi:hypothetical protein
MHAKQICVLGSCRDQNCTAAWPAKFGTKGNAYIEAPDDHKIERS